MQSSDDGTNFLTILLPVQLHKMTYQYRAVCCNELHGFYPINTVDALKQRNDYPLDITIVGNYQIVLLMSWQH